jgi:L-threonylcarbamoyladenylate synthase
MHNQDITGAAQALAHGELVAFPTETVYGLGADALNAQAVAKIYALKGRPTNHPLIVHLAHNTDIMRWAAQVPAYASTLIQHYWPGPLTLVLRKTTAVPDAVTGGQDTVGLRCPAHPVAQALLIEFARIGSGGVTAPSANRFGHVSPTTAQHVRDEFGAHTPLLLDGGACAVGIESTIIDCTGTAPVLLRPGHIGRAQIEQSCGLQVQDRHASSPRASGTLPAHYQPQTPVVLFKTDQPVLLQENAVVYALQRPQGFNGRFMQAPQDHVAYSHDLYALLRQWDTQHLSVIYIGQPPLTPAWEAVQDRLQRCAAPRKKETD